MTQLDLYVLAQAMNDTVVRPRASELHEFWKWNKPGSLQVMEKSPGYKGDWIGLRTLHQAGKLKRYRFLGDHVDYKYIAFWKDDILPLLEDPIDEITIDLEILSVY